MARKKQPGSNPVTEYRSKAEARTQAGGIPVFCSFDELADPRDLVQNPRNPNTHSQEQIKLLAHIIQSTGWRKPITVSNRSGYVVSGHGRLQAALLFGAECVPVDYQNYANEAEEWADLIADNRLAELSEIDNSKIAELIEEIGTGEVPITLTGYTEDDIENIIESMTEGESTEPEAEDDDEVPPQEIPMTKPGDLWILGDHRLICGSATDSEAIGKLMDGGKAHMVFTDPPYGVSYVSASGKFEMLENDGLKDDELIQSLILPALKNACYYTIEDAGFYIWHASSTRDDFQYAIKAAGLAEKQTIIWVKNGMVLGHDHYQWAHEPCFYCAKAGQTPRFFGDRTQKTVWKVVRRESGEMETLISDGLAVTDGEGGKIYMTEKAPKDKKTRILRIEKGNALYLYATGRESTVWQVSREARAEHPTQKPVELATRAIENSTNEGEVVLDLFAGSGSTLIAAEKTHRKARLAEIDPTYADVIVNRYARITGNVGGICIRDGKELPYARLKQENDEANGRQTEMR